MAAFINLQQKLNDLWASTIVSQHIDLLNRTISMNLRVTELNDVRVHVVIFKNVSSFYYINNTGEKRYDIYVPDTGDYTELTSIGYYKDGVGKIAIDSALDWTEQWYSSANFFMELWSAALFVEAKTIVIDGEVFDVGYPNIEEK